MFESVEQSKVVGVENTGERGAVLRKVFLFMLGILSAGATGFALEYSFHAGTFLWIPLVIAWTVWAGLFVISSLVLGFVPLAIKLFVEISIMSIPFWVRLQGWWPIAIWGTCMVLSELSYWHSTKTMGNVVKVNMGTIYLAARPSLIVVLSIVAGMGYMVLQFPNPDYFISKQSIVSLVQSLNPAFRVVYPGFDATGSLNGMVDVMIRKSIGSQPTDVMNKFLPSDALNRLLPSGVALPQDLKNAMLEKLAAQANGGGGSQLLDYARTQARAQLVDQLGNLVGRKLTGTETLPDILYQWMHDAYTKIPEQTKNLVHKSVMALVLLFFYVTFQFFGFAFDVAFGLIFGFLKMVGIVRMGTVMVEKEKLMI